MVPFRRRNAMKSHILSVLTAIATIGMVLTGSSVQAQHSLGIHFINGGTGAGGSGGNPSPTMDSSEVAGVVPQANWNNTPANFFAFNVGSLVDNNGVALDGTS